MDDSHLASKQSRSVFHPKVGAVSAARLMT